MATEIDPLAFQKGFSATQSIFDNARQNRLAELAMGQKQQELARQNALAGVVGDMANYDEAGNLLRTALPKIAAASPASLPQYQKMIAEQTAQQAAQQKAQRDQFIAQFDWADKNMANVRDQAGWDEFRARAATVYPDIAAKLPAQFDPAKIQANRMRVVPILDQLKLEQEREKHAEVARHNQATERNAAGQLAVSQGQLANSRARLSFDQGQAEKGQIVQTDQGPMIINTRTGLARPAVDMSGQPVQKPGKEIPASVNKSIIENQQNISKIDNAIAAIKKSPSALGTVNAVPGAETIRQYTGSPDDIAARAGVADVGSLILHDRSGAAVTASETPRLKPFIPMASDRPDVAIKKLERFKQIYEQESDLLAQTYSRDQGYKPSPALSNPAQKPSAAAPKIKVDMPGAKSLAGGGGWSVKEVK